MPIKINVKKSVNDSAIKNYVLFSDEEFKINSLNRLSLGRFSSTLNKMINLNSSKKKEILILNLNPTQRVIIIKLKNGFSDTMAFNNCFYNLFLGHSDSDSITLRARFQCLTCSCNFIAVTSHNN